MSAWLPELPSMFWSWPTLTISASCFFWHPHTHCQSNLKQSSRTVSLITSLLCRCFWWLLFPTADRLLFWYLYQLCIFDHLILLHFSVTITWWLPFVFSCWWQLCSFLEVNPRGVCRLIPLFPVRSLPKTLICFLSWAQLSVTVVHHQRPKFHWLPWHILTQLVLLSQNTN